MAQSASRTRLSLALALTTIVFAVEIAAALRSNSLALLAESFHVLIDVVALAIAVTAVWLAGRPTSDRRTFGLMRVEILATVVNTALLLFVALVVVTEGIHRFSEPAAVDSAIVLVVGIVGLVTNVVCALLLRQPDPSLLVRAAYLDVLSDIVSSGAVVVSAIAALAFDRRLADTLAAFLVVALIVPRAVALLREAIDVLLEATPRDVDLDVVRRHVLECGGVTDVHDLHVWAITSGVNVISAHVVVGRDADHAAVLDALQTCLRGDFDIDHSTFQLESEDRQQNERASHR